jgi:Undecaprenyl-phosphate glucose phosphotransferase
VGVAWVLEKLTVDNGETSTTIDPPVGLFNRHTFAHVSRWRLVAVLQVAEAFVVGTWSSVWLGSIAAETSVRVTQLERLYTAVVIALVVNLVLQSFGAYDFALILKPLRSSITAAMAWVLSTATLLSWVLKFGPYGDLGRASLISWLTGGACVVLVRLGVGYAGNALRRTGLLTHYVAIIGKGSEAQLCAKYLRSDRGGVTVVGLIAPESVCPIVSSNSKNLGRTSQLQLLIDSGNVDDVIVATSETCRANLSDLLSSLLCLPVRVVIWPASIGIEAWSVAASGYKIGEVPVILASVPPMHGWRWIVKDAQDRFLATLLLIVCLPVLLTIGIIIRVSSRGPILFRQEREGYNGHHFTIYKFRTMYAALPGQDGLVLTAKRDARIFPVGAILRKTSLDELPQLFNVIRGDMWLVGPRPHSPLATAAGELYSNAVKQYMSRWRVKPGITGWAQVNGWRGTTNTLEEIQQRVAYDLYYIENWSIWLDAKIMFQTAAKAFLDKNAY